MTLIKKANPVLRSNFKYLLSLLACVLTEKEPPKPNATTDWASVFYLAKEHSVLGMTCYAVEKLPDDCKPPKEMMQDFIDAKHSELILESNIQYETDLLLKEAKKASIPLVLLKGILLKHYYPLPNMRSMSDVDILFKKDDSKRISDLFKSMGYISAVKCEGELDFTKEPFYHFELHSNLVTEDDRSYFYFAEKFSDSVIDECAKTGSLSVDDTYIHILEHLAHHLQRSGAGLRMIMDVFVFTRAQKDFLNMSYIKEELKKLDLLIFAEKITDLAYNWFSGDNPDTDSLVADFILRNSTFGIRDNAVLQTFLRQDKSAGKKRSGFYHVFRHIFPEFRFISARFPSAKKFKVLYPYYVIKYWFVRVFINRNINMSGLKNYFVKSDADEYKRLDMVMEELGLSSRI